MSLSQTDSYSGGSGRNRSSSGGNGSRRTFELSGEDRALILAITQQGRSGCGQEMRAYLETSDDPNDPRAREALFELTAAALGCGYDPSAEA